jgi:hypothetical protein
MTARLDLSRMASELVTCHLPLKLITCHCPDARRRCEGRAERHGRAKLDEYGTVVLYSTYAYACTGVHMAATEKNHQWWASFIFVGVVECSMMSSMYKDCSSRETGFVRITCRNPAFRLVGLDQISERALARCGTC